MRLFFILASFIISSTVVYPQQQPASKESRALFFACNQYKHKNKGLANLQQPISNARSIAGLLEEKYGFKTEIIENPNRVDVFRKLKDYKSAYNNNEYEKTGQLLIFFTGHGKSEYSNGYFLTSDSDPSEYNLGPTAIEYDKLRGLINDIQCQHILVAIDACNSASFAPDFGNIKRSIESVRPGGRPGSENFDYELARYNRAKVRIYFTSDAQNNATPDNSIFAQQFFEGLEKGSKNLNFLTENELFANHVAKAQPIPGRGFFGDFDIEGIFLFFTKNQNPGEYLPELEFWEKVVKENTIKSYERFLIGYSNGEFASAAKIRIENLVIEKDWNYSKYLNTISAYERFIKIHPNSHFAEAAKLKIEEFRKFKPIKTSVFISMSKVPNGAFLMGGKNNIVTAEYTHQVSLEDFEIGRFEVTVEEYNFFCEDTNKSFVNDGQRGERNLPVINVSWFEAIKYCNWLSDKNGLTKVYEIKTQSVNADFKANGFRLPTEAEWEYAASYRKDGTKSLFGNGQSVADPRQLNFDGSQSSKKSYSVTGQFRNARLPVGSLNSPNELNIHDMSGNIREWCWDWYDEDYYDISPVENPTGPTRGTKRVVRGGDYTKGPEGILANRRAGFLPGFKHKKIGFRVARTL